MTPYCRRSTSARLAVTLGDPRGIGPEVMSVAARRFLDEDPGVELLVLGPAGADPGVGEYRGMGNVGRLGGERGSRVVRGAGERRWGWRWKARWPGL